MNLAPRLGRGLPAFPFPGLTGQVQGKGLGKKCTLGFPGGERAVMGWEKPVNGSVLPPRGKVATGDPGKGSRTQENTRSSFEESPHPAGKEEGRSTAPRPSTHLFCGLRGASALVASTQRSQGSRDPSRVVGPQFPAHTRSHPCPDARQSGCSTALGRLPSARGCVSRRSCARRRTPQAPPPLFVPPLRSSVLECQSSAAKLSWAWCSRGYCTRLAEACLEWPCLKVSTGAKSLKMVMEVVAVVMV